MTIARMPPQNLDAEQSTISSMLIDWSIIPEIRGILETKDFYKQSHRVIFEHICKLYDNGDPIDVMVNLAESLRKTKELEGVGDIPGLMGIMKKEVTAAYAYSYALKVKEKSMLRQMIGTTGKAMQQSYDGVKKFETIAAELHTELSELTISNVTELELEHVSKHITGVTTTIKEILDNKGMVGIPSNLTEIDKLTGGFKKQYLYYLAARPSMGKTALMLKFALNAAIQGMNVGIFSLEMSKELLGQRMITMISRVDLLKDDVSGEERKTLKEAVKIYEHLPISIDDSSMVSIDTIRAKATSFSQKKGLDILFVDYLQLMDMSSGENNQLGVSNASKGLKALARSLDIPVIVLSQLNRAVDGRNNKRPMLSDLRDSGSLEQDADTVMFIYRDEYYKTTNEKNQISGVAEVIFAKQRNGAIGTVKLKFTPATVSFDNLGAGWQ